MPKDGDVSSFPADLDATSRMIWGRVRGLMIEDGRWQPADSLTLELYVRCLERARRAQQSVAKEGRTTEGSQGQLVAHPELKTAREAEHDANDYARELGLTPAARAKAGEQSKPAAAGKLAAILG